MKRIVVADSTSCLNYVQQEHHIEILPLTLHIGDKQLRDAIDISATDFISWMRDNPDETPYSSAPSQDDINQHIKDWITQDIQEVLVITLSAGISDTYQNILTAAQTYKEQIKIVVFDSKTAVSGQAVLALEAEHLMNLGMPINLVVKQLEIMRKRNQLFFTVGQLNYLIKNGRLSVAAGMMANMLQIKPILTFDDAGKITVAEKKRRLTSALTTVIDYSQQFIGQERAQIFVLQSGNSEGIEFLEQVQQHYPQQNVVSLPPSPVIACHTGPELYGIGSFIMPAK